MPTAGAVPTRQTSEVDLDKWNQALRASPGYQTFMHSIGNDGSGRVKLSRGQQDQLEKVLAKAGVPVPSGMHIDQGGNLNQKNRLVRNTAIAVGMTGAALATAGAAGFGPLAGAMGGGAGAGGAAGAATTMGAGGVPSLGVTAGIAGSALPGTMVPIGASAAGGLTAAGGAAAAAKTAGGSSVLNRIMGASSKLAPILGGMAENNAAQRNTEGNQQLVRDRLNLDSASAQDRSILERAGIDMDRRKFEVAAPGQRLQTGVQGSIASKAHNVTVGQGPDMTLASGRVIKPIHYGGMGPDDLMTDDARKLGSTVTSQMLEQSLRGDKFDPMEKVDYPGATPQQPESVLDRITGGAAAGAGILGALAPRRRNPITGLDPSLMPGVPT